MDKTQWDLADYKFEQARITNEIVRKGLEIGKLLIRKKEIELSMSDIDLKIKQFRHGIEVNKKTIIWCKERIDKWQT